MGPARSAVSQLVLTHSSFCVVRSCATCYQSVLYFLSGTTQSCLNLCVTYKCSVRTFPYQLRDVAAVGTILFAWLFTVARDGPVPVVTAYR